MRRYLPAILIALFCLAVLPGCTPAGGEESPSPSVEHSEPAPTQSESPTPTPSQPEEPVETPTESLEPVPDVAGYSFGAPVEEGEPVEEAWFADAVFVGDSRTEGLQLFSGLRTGDFFWGKGMNVFKAVDRETKVVNLDGETLSILEALERKEYAKVYIMIGINELGYSTARYEEGLRALVDEMKAIQPNAVIYLQTLPPVNEGVAMASGLGSYIKNTKVNSFNEAIYRVAWEKQVALLDVASVYRTEEGELAADMAADGVHFYRQGYAAWYEYLKSHTLDAAAYENGAPLEEPIVPDVPEPPVYSPLPSESTEPEPSQTVQPTETPDVTPDPGETTIPGPSETVTPDPNETTVPGESGDAPSQEPAPTDSSAPVETEDPAPTETAQPTGPAGTP